MLNGSRSLYIDALSRIRFISSSLRAPFEAACCKPREYLPPSIFDFIQVSPFLCCWNTCNALVYFASFGSDLGITSNAPGYPTYLLSRTMLITSVVSVDSFQLKKFILFTAQGTCLFYMVKWMTSRGKYMNRPRCCFKGGDDELQNNQTVGN